jgi:hypothetical protein
VKRIKKIHIKILSAVTMIFLFLPLCPAIAEMKSANYVIYENLMHTFDGPTISGVNHSVNIAEVTVNWITNVVADSFVIYSTDPTVPIATSYEQGTSVKNDTNHSVVVSGLNESTIYYYRVKSTRINGGTTIDSTIRSFTTGATPITPAPPSSSGGGVIIIDKTDKKAPVITTVEIKNITSEKAEITWETNEPSTSFVEYGSSENYGSTNGIWSTSTKHQVILESLKPATKYNFRALSSDDWGNVGRSDNVVFTTLTEEGKPVEEKPEEKPENQLTQNDVDKLANQRIIDFINKLFPEITLNAIGDPYTKINNLNDLSGFVPLPILSGEPKVDISATEATVYWSTDIDATSQVAMATEAKFDPNSREPYSQIVGDTENLAKQHKVTLYGLTPDTTYHFQLRSKANLGQMARSRDFTFTTSVEELKITSFFYNIIDDQTAVFKWVTNKETNSAVKYAPYLNNILAEDESKEIKDNNFSVMHEIKITEMQAGTFYSVELISEDSKKNVAKKAIDRFSTNKDDLPPVISEIKADSTIFLDNSNKTQTIIFWLTNKPATSRVYFKEGVHGANVEFTESTPFISDYTKEHTIVVTKFKPGSVYSFRVESTDSTNKTTISKTHTFMTAKKKESIIQIIMAILENTFGWMKFK